MSEARLGVGARARVSIARPACTAVLAFALSARAESVPIGRYVELRVGVDPALSYPMSGADAQRSGRSRGRAPVLVPSRLWNVRLPVRRLVPPTLLPDGTLIVGSDRGLDALDPKSGAVLWSAAIGDVRFSPALTPAGELLAIADGKLWLVRADGAARALELPFSANGAPLELEAGTLIVLGRDGFVHALAADGAELMSIAAPAAPRGLRWSALVAGDTLLTASPSELTLYSLHEGRARSVRTPERIATNPVVGSGELFLLGEHGTLFVYDAQGELRSSVALGQAAAADGPALGWDGALRVGLRYGEIACFAPDGKERFRRGLDGAPSPMTIDADDTAIFVSARGTLYAIDRDGELRFRLATDIHSPGRPILARDGTLYLVGRGGVVAAYR